MSSSRKNAFTEAALDRLLNHNLSAKYALTGFLGMYINTLLTPNSLRVQTVFV